MTGARPPAVALHAPVLAAARRRPGATALRCGSAQLTYGELDRRSGLLAGALRAAGTGPDDIVAVHVPRGPALAVALLGVLRAGGAFLAIPADLPAGRVRRLVADAGARVAVAPAGALAGRPGLTVVDPAAAGVPADVPVDPLGAAYVVYTSGSTGEPKGVVVPHGAAAGHIRAMTAKVGLRRGDVVLQVSGESVDVFVEQLFCGLSAGATVLMRGTGPWGAAELREAFDAGGVTVADLPAALFAELAAGPPVAGAPRVLTVGGERLPVDAARRWLASGGPGLVNAYGPTETVITASVHRVVSAGTAPVPIGRAVGRRRLAVLDRELRPVRGAATGELYIGGAALARGYLGRPGPTAERFVPDPAGPPGSRMYRTGDLVRRSAHGLEFVGRADDQVKVSGYRVEPGEVEAVLGGHPAVALCCVTRDVTRDAARDVYGTGDGGRLAAHLVFADPAAAPTAGELREWAAERLPPWMVPAVWHAHDRLPVTAAGKVDRPALPYAPMAAPDPHAEGAPATETERRLAGIWRRVLGTGPVGVHDDFFRLGGTSLGAIRVIAAARAELGHEPALRDFYGSPTVAGLAALLDGGRAERFPPIPAVDDVCAPLSLMQEQIWFLEQLEPGNIAYNAPTTFRLDGPLDHGRLEAAVTQLVERHEILRTTIETSADGTPVQRVHPPYAVRIPVVEAAEAEVDALVLAEARRPFDVSELPLVRWTLLRTAPDAHELVLVEHHLVHDGWSFALLAEDLAALYRGEQPAPAAPVRYRDFARWQRRNAPEGQQAYWAERLRGADEGVDLPQDRPRPAAPAFTGGVHRVELPARLCERAREGSRAAGVTLFCTLLAAYVALLHRVGGQRDLCVGSAFANRRVPGTESVAGMFVNPVTLRFDLSGTVTFGALLGQAAAVTRDAQDNQELAFTRVVEALSPVRVPGRNPLFAAMFNMDDAPLGPIDLGDVRATYLERHNGTAKLDLSVLAVPRAERQSGLPERDRDRRITMIWEYRADLFDAATITRLAAQYEALLAAALDAPDAPVTDLPLPGETSPPAGEAPGEPEDVVALIERRAAAAPRREAVRVVGGGGLSYGELDRRATAVARLLRERGLGPEDVVALCADRDLDMPVLVLGALKSGAAYLPLDPSWPAGRLADVIRESGARAVLTGDRRRPHAEAAAGGVPVIVPGGRAPSGVLPPCAAVPGNAAYLITTSGSTGKPKRVVITRAGLAAEYRAWELAYRLEPAGHAQVASFAFDVCTGEIVRALASGGTLVVCPADVVLDPAALHRALHDHDVRYAELLPSVARLLVDHCAATGASLSFLRLIAVGGEPWTPAEHAALRRAAGPDTRVLNVYGVTEATVGSTLWEGEAAGSAWLPIGAGLPGVTARVLDGSLRPAPVGTAGEIHLSGPTIARGYHGRPARTAERFRPDPAGAPGDRLYATGDRGRLRPDGAIEFLGRDDRQVKVRGFRVEPGEVEAVLRGGPGVRDAVVVAAREDTGRVAGLAAFVLARPGEQADAEALADWLRRRLPGHLVPGSVTVLPRFPRTATGKIDRSGLGVLAATAPARPPGPSTAPRDDLERAIAAVLGDVLGGVRVGAFDDFFALGGHSLLAARAAVRLRGALGREVSVRDLLAAPSVAALARRLNGAAGAGAQPAVTRADRRAYLVAPDAFDSPENAGTGEAAR
ncbi:amino acid adenylation domain-containing protein [Planomonospora sp. ID67723]|uniref:non-ribosomal peptide synthetase n=1 Tax=Planomonospora sp. ID67723 TaxID=2738134 RepID=UPI0018C372D1|nr:non-ribosomal peptide synthetase [Planomonospora sp. ID67723]MBG0832646.1 amino acid adenylation domain-containing protein [Planomonospora sp. ID67723]